MSSGSKKLTSENLFEEIPYRTPGYAAFEQWAATCALLCIFYAASRVCLGDEDA